MPMAGRKKMPRKKAKHKEVEAEKIVDSFESWLERQPFKPARAKSGFVGDAKIEDSP
jgi:hypothetical protein